MLASMLYKAAVMVGRFALRRCVGGAWGRGGERGLLGFAVRCRKAGSGVMRGGEGVMAGSLCGSRRSEVRRQKALSAQMEEATARGRPTLNRFAVCLLQQTHMWHLMAERTRRQLAHVSQGLHIVHESDATPINARDVTAQRKKATSKHEGLPSRWKAYRHLLAKGAHTSVIDV